MLKKLQEMEEKVRHLEENCEKGLVEIYYSWKWGVEEVPPKGLYTIESIYFVIIANMCRNHFQNVER